MIPRLPQPLEDNCVLIIPNYSQQEINLAISQLQECKDLTKSHLITFIKSEDKAKSIMMLHEKIEMFRKSCKQAKITLLEGNGSE
jgi:hypothetical protein